MTGEVPADERIERIRTYEELKAALSAAQAREAVAFEASRRAEREAAGVPEARRGQGIASEIALARHESPNVGFRMLGLAKALVHEMPRTLKAVADGRLSEWRATLVVRETACLSLEDRRRVDDELAGDDVGLDRMGNRALVGAVRRLAYRLDPHAVVKRARKAESERTVTCRPAPDTMMYVTALLPVKQGVAAYAALSRAADSQRAQGDARSGGQIMADEFVQRLTGLKHADAVPLAVNLIMTDRTLLHGDVEPAHLDGYGVVPAQWARDAVRREGFPAAGARRQVRRREGQPRRGADPDPPAVGGGQPGGVQSGRLPPGGPPGAGRIGLDRPGLTDPPIPSEARTWIRRLYTAPGTGELVAMDSRARLFPSALRRFIALRDHTCRTPWCDAPVRHGDHVVAWARGGTTSAANAAGLCEQCNQAKEAPGWSTRLVPGGRHTFETITPSGRIHRSTAPALPGTPMAAGPPDAGPGAEAGVTRIPVQGGEFSYPSGRHSPFGPVGAVWETSLERHLSVVA
ncbi:HNH endonuclease [Arthrobacter ginkgonis]|uniref:HNH endonuclease n=1 Tax=Arthrobacter ginkgonis TaxID=1630594 RepID=UPI0031EFD3D5